MQDGWWLAKCLRRYLALREQKVSYRCCILADFMRWYHETQQYTRDVLAIEILLQVPANLRSQWASIFDHED